jgi:hypothetical protein
MNDENFDKLRTLLTLKNHEQPPPGYFNRLPGKILARIEASELASESTWWNWLVERFDARPILACAYGFTISGLLLMGFRVSQLLQADAQAETTSPSFGGSWLAAGPDPITTGTNCRASGRIPWQLPRDTNSMHPEAVPFRNSSREHPSLPGSQSVRSGASVPPFV